MRFDSTGGKFCISNFCAHSGILSTERCFLHVSYFIRFSVVPAFSWKWSSCWPVQLQGGNRLIFFFNFENTSFRRKREICRIFFNEFSCFYIWVATLHPCRSSWVVGVPYCGLLPAFARSYVSCARQVSVSMLWTGVVCLWCVVCKTILKCTTINRLIKGQRGESCPKSAHQLESGGLTLSALTN